MREWTPEWLVSKFKVADKDQASLIGIEEIPWESLSHAHGVASDVPALLRAVLSDNSDHREFAFALLHETIWHQGDIYEATPYVVPFLYAMLRSSDTLDKVGVAFLIATLANGRFWLERVTKDAAREAFWREYLSEQGKSIDEVVIRGREIVELTRALIGQDLPLLYPYLQHSDGAVRGNVAKALGNFPERAEELIPLLDTCLASEQDRFTVTDIQEALVKVRGRVRGRG